MAEPPDHRRAGAPAPGRAPPDLGKPQPFPPAPQPFPPAPRVLLHSNDGAGGRGHALLWRFGRPVRCVASTVLGGGLGPRSWVLNATVNHRYEVKDPARHAAALAESLGLDPSQGAVLLTALDVRRWRSASDAGAWVCATVGLAEHSWAAAPADERAAWRPGTINVLAWASEPLADAALVNLVATIAEAKAQAMREWGLPATGTPSDAVAVCCPAAAAAAEQNRYGGPRSTWGARVARAAHHAISAGIAAWAREAR